MDWIVTIACLAGWLAGLGLWHVFRRLPTDWLLEYGETEIPVELTVAQRSRIWPDAVVMMATGAILAGVGWIRLGLTPAFLLFCLSAAVLLLILIADWKTRIIPDPLTLLLAVLTVVTIIYQFWSGHQAWLALLWRLLAGIGAGAFFLLIGWIGEKMAGQEAMGMGDVKLIVVCIWLVDYPNTVAVIFLSFITASIFAVPLLVQKYWPGSSGSTILVEPRKSALSADLIKDETDVAQGESSDEVDESDEIDGMLAFGPFIVIATLLVQLAQPELATFWQLYLGQF